MQETLLIRLGATPEAPVEYALMDAAGQLLTQAQTAGLADLRAHAAGRPVIALVPGEQLTLTAVELPTQSLQRLRKAVPYALEEQLIEDVEQLHFALGETLPDGRISVAVMARDLLQAWCQAFEAHGLEVRRLVPAPLAVPRPAQGWQVLLDSNEMLLHGADGSALATDAATADWMFARLANPAAPAPVQLAHRRDLTVPEVPEGVTLTDSTPLQSALTLLARGVQADAAINLLQGDFARTPPYTRVWHAWRAAAIVAGVVLVLGFVQQGLTLSRLEAEQQALNERIEQVYRQAFPNARRIVNPRVQMEQQLRALRRQQGATDGDFMTLLALSGEVLTQARQVELLGASYRDGTLDLSLKATDVQSLDQLKQALTRDGRLAVEIESASARDGEVEGRLSVREVSA